MSDILTHSCIFDTPCNQMKLMLPKLHHNQNPNLLEELLQELPLHSCVPLFHLNLLYLPKVKTR